MNGAIRTMTCSRNFFNGFINKNLYLEAITFMVKKFRIEKTKIADFGVIFFCQFIVSACDVILEMYIK